MGVIDREKTHFENINLEDILSSDAFFGGMKFHSLVDEVREDFMKSNGLYSLFPNSKFATQAVKFFEDKIFYEKINDWDSVKDYFKEFSKSEFDFGIKKIELIKWHNLLSHYFSEKPDSSNQIDRFIKEMGMSKEMSDEIVRVLEDVIDEDMAKKIIEDFYNQFDNLIVV